ncbi:RNA 2'-phosphotransferase [Spirochaeta cellobiosiphila]|uniref:RNA 2'-phosphotransferase n=1 Tax=Spirochaeta cellobiosiphila TaxID=504483 RepID=UPI0003FDE533|nr:RNA 2'-phosphotransferase [Spirochaeta cellobiosiphila]
MDSKLTQISKFLSYILRHKPDAIGITLDQNGWASIDDLLLKSRDSGTDISREDFFAVVEQNDKKRFSLSDDRQKIRAAQGHSLDVDLALEAQTPPQHLFHGTATRFLESIMKEGINSGSRQKVHLSTDKETALKVGQRHGKPIVLTISASQMHKDGFRFNFSENGVWLTDKIPTEYINTENISLK